MRNLMDEFVIPFVEELCRRLPVRGSDSSLGHEGSEGEGKELDGPAKGTTWSPHKGEQDDNTLGKDGKLSFSMVFKLAAELETNAYPALDELTKKVSSSSEFT
jgi:magnesium transporter